MRRMRTRKGRRKVRQASGRSQQVKVFVCHNLVCLSLIPRNPHKDGTLENDSTKLFSKCHIFTMTRVSTHKHVLHTNLGWGESGSY